MFSWRIGAFKRHSVGDLGVKHSWHKSWVSAIYCVSVSLLEDGEDYWDLLWSSHVASRDQTV